MFSLKLRPGPAWHRQKNLAPHSFSLSISCSLTSRDTCRYWNDYVPGLCRYPDVHLMIKKEPGECIWPSFFPPFELPCLVLVVFFSPRIFSCTARTGCWLGMKVEVELEGSPMGDDSPISQSLWGRQKEWREERGRRVERWSPPHAFLPGLICPLVCQGTVGVLTVADADFVPSF